MEVPNLGIFGVGRMGRVHVEHLVKLHNAHKLQFVCLGDSHPATAESTLKAISEHSPKLANEMELYTCPKAMSLHSPLDGVVIASRTSNHAQDASEFVKQDVPVLVEKPLTGKLNECVSLASICEQQPNAFIFVAFQRHYDQAGQLARRWVQQGQIGQLQQSHHVIQDKNPTPVGYQSCGITADMAIHLVYEALSFRNFEMPTSVQALRFNAPHYEDRAEEGANIVHTFLTWRDGSLAHLWGSRLNVTGYDNGFKLMGTEGRIDVGEFVGDFGAIKARLWCGNGKNGQRGVLTEDATFEMTSPQTPSCFSAQPDFYPRYAQAYENELLEFAQCIGDRSRVELGFEVGWKTQLVANAAELSSKNGSQPISLLSVEKPVQSIKDAILLASAIGLH